VLFRSNGVDGQDGLSAYQIWLNAGNTGTEQQFLTSLQGATGPQGPIGLTGPAGAQGSAGVNGVDGQDGLSAYQIWLNAGNTGTEQQFLTSLQGATGSAGVNGIQNIPFLHPNEYNNNSNYNFGDIIYDVQSGKLKIAVPASDGSQKLFVTNPTTCPTLMDDGCDSWNLTFNVNDTMIFSSTTTGLNGNPIYLAFDGNCVNNSSGCCYQIQHKLFEVPNNSPNFTEGVEIGWRALLVPNRTYRIKISGFCSGSNSSSYKLKIGALPTVDNNLISNAIFWKSDSPAGGGVAVNSITTSFPVFSFLGGFILSSPPILSWKIIN
jgi:hypothetical protein